MECLDKIVGFSARFTGGGTGFISRLNSPDRRGGGGDGGLEPVVFESRRGSRTGEWVRLGILNVRGELAGVVAAVIDSGLRKAVCSLRFTWVVRSLGGESGG